MLSDCPLSIVADEGDTVTPASTDPLTVTVSPAEHCDAAEYAESVTLYEYEVVVVGEARYVAEVAPPMDDVQVPSEYHWYVREPVPPEGWDVRVTDWPLLMAGPDGVIAPVTSAGLTTTKIVLDVSLAAGVPAELSVTV